MWIINFLRSSIGQKIIMSLTGLFLISFLTIHLIGNLQLFYNDEGVAFNTYAYFMTHNPLIKAVSYGLYGFILLHTAQGIFLWLSNKSAKGGKYAVAPKETGSWSAKNMAVLGLLILAFLFIHMGDFWFKMKIGSLPMVDVPAFDHQVTDLYGRVVIAYQNLILVILYLIGLIALAFHLNHGFASAFQTLGLRHKKYTPLIELLGKAYSIIVPLGFAAIPLYIYFTK